MRKLFQFFLFSAILFCAGSMAGGSGKYWAVTHQWSGNGSCQTEPFKIYGAKWRIHARFDRRAKPEIKYFSTETEDFTPVFKFSRQHQQNRYNRVVTLKNKDQGDKFLSIKCDDSPWTITVEQYFDHTDDWLSRKDRVRRITPEQTLGTWSGTGNRKISFETPEVLWFVQAVPQQEGTFHLTVRNSEKQTVFSSGTSMPDRQPRCFFYAPGSYEIEVKADADLPWVVYAYQPGYKSLLKP